MEALRDSLCNNFDLKGISSFNKVQGGFLCNNFSFEAAGKKFFLKEYRFEDKNKVAEIHKIKQFFFSKGIPAILPIKTKQTETFFVVGKKIYALFPFIVGVHYIRGTIPISAIESLGKFLAKIHIAGAQCNFHVEGGFKDKGAEAFVRGAQDIIKIIRKKRTRDAFDESALRGLELKIKLTERDAVQAEILIKELPILLHGDYHEQNIFFDEMGNIKNIFDFEKSIMGPRSFELWRSADYMFLNGIFSDKRIADVILYFQSYNQTNPISEVELCNGLDIYYQRSIRSLWVEQEHYLKGSTRTDLFLDNRMISYLSENREEFKRRIVEGVYRK